MNKKLIWFIIADLIITGGILLFVFYFNSGSSQDQNNSDFSLSSEQNSNVENMTTEETEDSSSNIIIITLISLLTVVITAFSFRSLFKYVTNSNDRKKILANGRLAKAKIIELGESGRGVVTINNQPFVSLKLEVYDGSNSPYQTEIKTIIGRLDVPKFQPGNMLAIKIDPKDKMKVAIDPERDI